MPWNSNNNSPNTFASGQTLQPVSQASAETRMDFIRKTYVLFMAGIVAAVIAGAITVSSRPVFDAAVAILQRPLIGLVLLFGSVWIASALARTEGLNYVALFGFTAFCGFWITPLLAIYEQYQPGIVTQAAVLTLLTFGALTTYAFVTKKDFSFLGGILFVGLITLAGGMLLNIFWLKSSMMSYWMSWGILLIFSGYVLFDTSRIIHRYDEKSYCSAAIALFLDFFNMFLAILGILSGRTALVYSYLILPRLGEIYSNLKKKSTMLLSALWILYLSILKFKQFNEYQLETHLRNKIQDLLNNGIL